MSTAGELVATKDEEDVRGVEKVKSLVDLDSDMQVASV